MSAHILNVRIDTEPLLLRLDKGTKRLAYAAVGAINATARRIQDVERQHVETKLTVRKREFVQRQIAIIKPFASVKKGLLYADVSIGQKDRLLLSLLEPGGTREPLPPPGQERPLGKNVGVPITGSARPSIGSSIPSDLTFKGLRIVKRQVVTRRNGRKRSVRVRADVKFAANVTRTGKVQLQGEHRSFILKHTDRLPWGGVFQRIGPGRDDIRLLYKFLPPMPLHAMLEWIPTAEEVANTWFGEEMERATIDALVHDRGRSFAAVVDA
jgi:hypothetical protein